MFKATASESPAKPTSPKLTPHDRARLRAVSFCDEATLKKYPDVSPASRLRIELAAKALGICLPAARP